MPSKVAHVSMEEIMQEIPRRTFIAWVLSFVPVGLLTSCGTPNPKEKEKDPKEQQNETRKAALQAAAWMEQEKNSIKNQNHRIWLALTYYALGESYKAENNKKEAEKQFGQAKREWTAAWENREQSINVCATLGYLFVATKPIKIDTNTEAHDKNNQNLAQQFFTADTTTDDTYQIDDYLLQITRGKSNELITTITGKGLADTKQGNPRLDVSLLIALFILLYNTDLANEKIDTLQEWCIQQKKTSSSLTLTEKSLILAILTFGNGKKTHKATIDEIRKEILAQQDKKTYSWKASAGGNDKALEANFLQTATTAMAIAMSQ